MWSLPANQKLLLIGIKDHYFFILHDINGELKTVFFTDVDLLPLATWELQWEKHTVLKNAQLGTLGKNVGFHSL